MCGWRWIRFPLPSGNSLHTDVFEPIECWAKLPLEFPLPSGNSLHTDVVALRKGENDEKNQVSIALRQFSSY